MKASTFIQMKLYCFMLYISTGSSLCAQTISTPSNKEIVQSYFKKWADGTGNIFEILDENATWTISGSSKLSKTYTSKKQLLEEVIDPLNQRLSRKIVPTLRIIFEDGNTVIVIWDGKATAKDGKPYDVSYAWFMEMQNGKIIKVTAFLDTLDFSDIFERIKP